MVPDNSYTFDLYVKRVGERYNDTIAKKKRCCNETILTRKYEGETLGLIRLRFPEPHHKDCEGCWLPSGVWEDGIHLMCYMDPANVDMYKTQYLLLIPYLRTLCSHQALSFLGSVTALLRSGGTYIHESWRKLAYWERLFGYMANMKRSDLQEEVYDWLKDPKVMGGPLSGQWNDMVYQETRDIMREEFRMPKKVLPFAQWAASCVWMRGRAGDNEKHSVVIDGKPTSTRKMKPLDAVRMSDRDIMMQVTNTTPDRLVIAQKSEHGKIRPIVKSSNANNRRWDYVMHLIEDGLRPAITTRVFGGAAKNEELDMELIETCNKSTWKLPLDHSNYDHRQTKGMLKAMLLAVFDHISPLLPHEIANDWRTVFKSAFDSQFNRRVMVDFFGDIFEWQNGLPSGLRITSLMGTLGNLVGIRIAKKIVNSMYTREMVHTERAQGDDCSLECETVQAAQEMLGTMTMLGYKIHPFKTFLSRERTEFLQRSIERKGITGYFARLLLGLRFTSPIQEAPICKVERVASRFTSWHLCCLRGADINRCMMMYILDATQVGLSRQQAVSLAMTPRVYGGLGIAQTSRMAQVLLPHWNGMWTKMVILKERRHIKFNYGKWITRILNTRSITTSMLARTTIPEEMLITWGVRQSKIWGKITVMWMDMLPNAGRYETLSHEPLPDSYDVWDMEGIPNNLIEHVKSADIDSGSFLHIKPEYLPIVLRTRGRVSRTVFEGWLTDKYEISLPCIDQYGQKYCGMVKRRYKQLLLGLMGKKDMNETRLRQNMLYWELAAPSAMQNAYKAEYLSV